MEEAGRMRRMFLCRRTRARSQPPQPEPSQRPPHPSPLADRRAGDPCDVDNVERDPGLLAGARRAVWPGAVTIAALVLGACGTGVSGSAPVPAHPAAQPPSSSPRTPPSSPTDVARERAIAAY